MMRSHRGAIHLVLGFCALGFVAAASRAAVRERAPVLTTPRFVFFSDFDTNLNDALVAVGVARRFRKPELFQAAAEPGAEAACFEALPPSARAGWNGAAAFYAEIVAPAEWNARQQYLLRQSLAGFEADTDDASARQYVGIARGFLAAAAPAYEACRWSAQDEQNRRWIAQLAPQLAAHGEEVATRLERIYRKRWNGGPIHVDMVETVSWAGANSTFPESLGGHLLISSESPGAAALELVFHESSHGLMLPGDPLRQALDDAAAAAGLELPGDLWHPVLFFTTGEVVRRALEAGGRPGYTPMIEEIYPRSPWGAWREAIAREWAPYVRGERALDAAARALVAAVGRRDESSRDGSRRRRYS